MGKAERQGGFSWVASPPRYSALPESWSRCHGSPGSVSESGHQAQWSVYGGWDTGGSGFHLWARALSCSLSGCRAPLNLSLFFHQMGPQPLIRHGCLGWGDMKHRIEGAAQNNSFSMQHGSALTKPGAHSRTVLLSVLQTWELRHDNFQVLPKGRQC